MTSPRQAVIGLTMVDTRGWDEAASAHVDRALRPLLTPDELARAGRFRARRDRDCFIVGRATVRRLAGERLGVEPSTVAFDRTCEHCDQPTHGRPRLAGGAARALEFSVSHAGGVVVVATSRDVPCGVDVEALDPRASDLRTIAGRLAPSEQRRLATAEPDAFPFAMLGLWTRKEAYAKGIGLGLALAMDRFEVSVPPAPAAILRPARGFAGWRLLDVDSPLGTVAALAYRADVPAACVDVPWPFVAPVPLHTP